MGLTRITEPSELPVGLSEVKSHVRVDCADEHELLRSQIQAATDWAEKFTGLQFVTATWQLTLGDFPSIDRGILLPYPPLKKVNSIEYIDQTGNTETVSASKYKVITTTPAGYVEPAYGELWPNTRNESEAVTIKYDAGFGSASDVPEPIKLAIKMLTAHWFDMRHPVTDVSVNDVPMTVGSLLSKYQIREVV